MDGRKKLELEVSLQRLTPAQIEEAICKRQKVPTHESISTRSKGKKQGDKEGSVPVPLSSSSDSSSSKSPGEIIISYLAAQAKQLNNLYPILKDVQYRVARIENIVAKNLDSEHCIPANIGDSDQSLKDLDLGLDDSDAEESRLRRQLLIDNSKASTSKPHSPGNSPKMPVIKLVPLSELTEDTTDASDEDTPAQQEEDYDIPDNMSTEIDLESGASTERLPFHNVETFMHLEPEDEPEFCDTVTVENAKEEENLSDLGKVKSDSDIAASSDEDTKKKSNAKLTKETENKSKGSRERPARLAKSNAKKSLNHDFSSKDDSDESNESNKSKESRERPARLAKSNAKKSLNHDFSNKDDSDESNESNKSTPVSSEDDDDDFQPLKLRTKTAKRNLRKALASSDDESNKSGDEDSKKSDGNSAVSESENSDSDGKKKKRKRQKSSDSSSLDGTDKSKKRRRVKVIESSSKSDDSDIEILPTPEKPSPSKGRKNIKKILKEDELDKSTRQAAREEEARQTRLAERQKQFNDLGIAVVDFEGDKVDKLVLDIDKKTKQPVLVVDQIIVDKLKPHQAKGIKFMWDACFESVENRGVGGGCILAHCMGLGKTLQTVGFLHTVMTNERLKVRVRTALVICPLNTVGNWYHELKFWVKNCDTPLRLHKLWEIKPKDKYQPLADWKRLGGVGIIHYDCFRSLATLGEQKKSGKGSKKVPQKYLDIVKDTLLDPGPDIVICDEGHLLKNISSQTTKAVLKIRTQRRIILTGTPLQNNLLEYHTMMHFVKPNLLGTRKEFSNRFVNPIVNGQHADSSDQDVKRMKRRAHVLHKLLHGCVQRLDYSVLTPYLPPKLEYAISINLSAKQAELYEFYLKHVAEYDAENGTKLHGAKLFTDYTSLVKVWTHPILLTLRKNDSDGAESEGSMKDFICDTSSEEDDVVQLSGEEGEDKPKLESKKRTTRQTKASSPVEEPVNDIGMGWYSKFFANKEEMEKIDLSGKMVVLFEILKTCESIGDKVLVFSQYITTLNLIEDFLSDLDTEARKKVQNETKIFPPPKSSGEGRWRPNIEYFRIDGSTKTDDRKKHCDTFNKQSTSRAKLFLISTRAGGLGINLVGANRVVIFDASWNPSQDLQSIFRVYRFGQVKPCYVYRLLARGTMEERIYNRQVVKLSLSCRVVDEQQIERHFQFDEIRDMYKFNPAPLEDRPIPIVPKDRLLADLLIAQENWIYSYLEHDSLLENKEEEELTEEERKAAWDDYNNENSGRSQVASNLNPQILDKLRLVHVHASEEDIRQMCIQTQLIYPNLQKNIAVLNNPMAPLTPMARVQITQNVTQALLQLKQWFGDTVNWNQSLNYDPQASAPVQHQQLPKLNPATFNAGIQNVLARGPGSSIGRYQQFAASSGANTYMPNQNVYANIAAARFPRQERLNSALHVPSTPTNKFRQINTMVEKDPLAD